MPDNKHTRILLRILYIALGIAVAFLVIRYLLPWLLPFVLALLTARLIEPFIKLLKNKFSFRRGFASVVSSTLVLAMIVALAVFIGYRTIYEITALVNKLPALLAKLPQTASTVGDKVHRFIVSAPVEVQDYLQSVMSSIGKQISAVPGILSAKLLALLSSWAGYAPRIILFAVTYVISVYFISGSYPDVTAFIMSQIPRRFHERVREMKQILGETIGKWGKAQLILMGVTFCELTIAFLYLRIEYAVILALVIALVDALPALGTGLVLIPWAAVCLMMGETSQTIVLAITYGAASLVRSFLEPKLLGEQMGLHPIASLIAMYLGYSTIGIMGMILFPITLIILKQFHDRGYLKLWK